MCITFFRLLSHDKPFLNKFPKIRSCSPLILPYDTIIRMTKKGFPSSVKNKEGPRHFSQEVLKALSSEYRKSFWLERTHQ